MRPARHASDRATLSPRCVPAPSLASESRRRRVGSRAGTPSCRTARHSGAYNGYPKTPRCSPLAEDAVGRFGAIGRRSRLAKEARASGYGPRDAREHESERGGIAVRTAGGVHRFHLPPSFGESRGNSPPPHRVDAGARLWVDIRRTAAFADNPTAVGAPSATVIGAARAAMPGAPDHFAPEPRAPARDGARPRGDRGPGSCRSLLDGLECGRFHVHVCCRNNMQ